MSTGIARERQVRDYLQKRDWVVARCAGSLGEFDLMAMRKGERILVEVKATQRGPFHSFGPKDRADILFHAELAGADAWLAWWPSRGKLHWLHSSEWPGRTPREATALSMPP